MGFLYLPCFSDESGSGKIFAINGATIGEDSQISDVDDVVLELEDIGESSPRWQALDKRQLTSLEVRMDAWATTSFLSLGALARVPTVSAAQPPAHTFFLLLCPRGRTQVVLSYHLVFHLLDLDQMLHLEDHAPDRGRILFFDSLLQAVQTQRPQSLPLISGITDIAFHPSDA